MSELHRHVEEYLRLRRGLGYQLAFEGAVLPQLADYLDARGCSTLTAEAAITWAQLPEGVSAVTRSHRLVAARGFAAYLRTIDPATQVPPRGVFRIPNRRPRPYIWSDDEISALMAGARGLRPPLRAATHEALFGLIAVSGMRISEAIGLRRDDVDVLDGVVTIRQAKFGRSRLVPLHSTSTVALGAYAQRRDRLCPAPRADTFFLSGVGTPLRANAVRLTFDKLTTSAGIRTATRRPRIHDLRHRFAVATLMDWHRDGADVEARMPVLSSFLGHLDPKGTYWYLSATPELMGLAAERLARAERSQP